MISDDSQRYSMTQVNETMLWRYDRRWRSIRLHEPAGGRPFTFFEGKNHGIVVAHDSETARTELSVRSASAPDVVVAAGTYTESWKFAGENAAWALVPEYVLVPDAAGHHGLLRIADGATVDPLEGFGFVSTVSQVPDSRLVVLAGDGAYTVYDPIAGRAIRRYELASKNPAPTLRFRNDQELWLNDVGTMLKIETKQFEVIDAAGSETHEEPMPVRSQDSEAAETVAAPSETELLGEFGQWTFVSGNELCVVTRPFLGDVLILDALSMLPVARAQFPGSTPVDATLIGRNTVIAVDSTGKALRRRVKRVRINFEE